MLGGLLIAAASAGGFSPIGVPVVKAKPGGSVSAMLLLDGAQPHDSHVARSPDSAVPDPLVAPASHDFRKVLEVFARRPPGA